jgi:hypothetical protein
LAEFESALRLNLNFSLPNAITASRRLVSSTHVNAEYMTGGKEAERVAIVHGVHPLQQLLPNAIFITPAKK